MSCRNHVYPSPPMLRRLISNTFDVLLLLLENFGLVKAMWKRNTSLGQLVLNTPPYDQMGQLASHSRPTLIHIIAFSTSDNSSRGRFECWSAWIMDMIQSAKHAAYAYQIHNAVEVARLPHGEVVNLNDGSKFRSPSWHAGVIMKVRAVKNLLEACGADGSLFIPETDHVVFSDLDVLPLRSYAELFKAPAAYLSAVKPFNGSRGGFVSFSHGRELLDIAFMFEPNRAFHKKMGPVNTGFYIAHNTNRTRALLATWSKAIEQSYSRVNQTKPEWGDQSLIWRSLAECQRRENLRWGMIPSTIVTRVPWRLDMNTIAFHAAAVENKLSSLRDAEFFSSPGAPTITLQHAQKGNFRSFYNGSARKWRHACLRSDDIRHNLWLPA